MQLEDRRSVVLPESVTLELQVAGIGSRFLSGLVDLILMYVLLIALALPIGRAARGSGNVVVAIVIVLFFCTFFGYGMFFDTVGRGRSPGKRMAGTRVVRLSDGGAVRGRAAAIRSILRIVDQSSIGLISVLVTPLHQRLGDLVAGTIVVVEPLSPRATRRRRKAAARAVAAGAVAPAVQAGWTGPNSVQHRSTVEAGARIESSAPWASWDVTAVSAQDLTAIRAFLARRDQLNPRQRQRIAHDFAGRLFDKVAGVDQPPAAETFLEWILEAKQRRGA